MKLSIPFLVYKKKKKEKKNHTQRKLITKLDSEKDSAKS